MCSPPFSWEPNTYNTLYWAVHHVLSCCPTAATFQRSSVFTLWPSLLVGKYVTHCAITSPCPHPCPWSGHHGNLWRHGNLSQVSLTDQSLSETFLGLCVTAFLFSYEGSHSDRCCCVHVCVFRCVLRPMCPAVTSAASTQQSEPRWARYWETWLCSCDTDKRSHTLIKLTPYSRRSSSVCVDRKQAHSKHPSCYVLLPRVQMEKRWLHHRCREEVRPSPQQFSWAALEKHAMLSVQSYVQFNQVPFRLLETPQTMIQSSTTPSLWPHCLNIWLNYDLWPCQQNRTSIDKIK